MVSWNLEDYASAQRPGRLRQAGPGEAHLDRADSSAGTRMADAPINILRPQGRPAGRGTGAAGYPGRIGACRCRFKSPLEVRAGL